MNPLTPIVAAAAPEPRMSRSRSTSLEIVPPSNSRSRGLADVVDTMFKDNGRHGPDDSKDLEDVDAEADEIDDDGPPHKGTSASVVSNEPRRRDRRVC